MATAKTTKQAGKTEDEAAEETVALYTLSELSTRLGKATEDEVHVYVEGRSKAALIQEGARVGTSRIDTDCARLYGQAADFFDHATPAQRAHVVGVTPKMLRAAVTAAEKGSALAAKRESASNKANADKGARTGDAVSVRASCMLRRKVLKSGLRAVAGGQESLLSAIDLAHGTADTNKNLADALDALVGVGRRMLRGPAGALKERLHESGLTKALLDETVTLAESLRGAGEAADAVTSKGTVSQAEVDYWDGINLMLLGTFLEVFETAHEVDPTIPRLFPIALRSYYSPSRKKPKKGEGPEPGGTPGAPS